MGSSHSSNNQHKETDNNNIDDNSANNKYKDPDGGELPVEYFYEYRDRNRSNLDRTILLDIFSEEFGSMRHQVKANTTIKEVKEIINQYIPLGPQNFFLEINKSRNYDDKKIVNDCLFDECDVVMITIHDLSPKFTMIFDITDIKDDFKELQINTLEFRPYNRLIQAYKKVSKKLNISSFRYNLRFNGELIPFANNDQLQQHFIDLNLTNGSSALKIENLNPPPPPESGFEITIHFYGKKENFKASRKNIVDDLTFTDILSSSNKKDLYFVLMPKGKVLDKNETFEEQGVLHNSVINAIIKLRNGK